MAADSKHSVNLPVCFVLLLAFTAAEIVLYELWRRTNADGDPFIPKFAMALILLFVLTLPINILTFGLFTFVINAIMLRMASGVISGFEVTGFWPAFFGSLVISLISWGLNSFVNDRGRFEVIDLRRRGVDRWE